MINRILSIKSIQILVLALTLIICLTGCGSQIGNVPLYESPKAFKKLESIVVDSNESFSLEWNNEKFCALIRDLKSGKVWSTTPYDVWENGGGSSISSAIYIQYYNMITGVLEETRASECVDNGTISVATKDNVLRQIIYFEDAGIRIPIEYTLTKDGMHVEIRASEIRERAQTKLVSISFLPYMASTVNTDSKDSYLVTPVGSGALSYTIPEKQNSSRALELPVYGVDLAQQRVEYPTEEVKVNLPVYGVKSQNEGLFAVISSGAESAQLHIESGNIRTEHSTVYPKFVVHGYDRFEVEMQDFEDDNVYNDNFSSSAVYSVDYYPLSNNEATYSGMANFYRDKVLKLKENDNSNAVYKVTLCGGTMVKDFVFGIPTQKLRTLTDFDETKRILSDLCEITGEVPQAELYGYGNSGIDIGEIGGGFTFANVLGGKNGAQKLEEFCEEKGIELFTDFRIFSFSKSGNGFSTAFDVAKTANMQYSYYYNLYKNIPMQNTSLNKIRCLKRDKLDLAIEKLLKFANDRISGMSFSDLGNEAYSDYRDEKYYVKGNISTQVGAMLSKVKKAGHSISLKAANGYAAIYSDSICDIPLTNGGYSIFDESIPFYQMVFRGSTSLYGEALNLSADTDKMKLKLLEYGVYPSFILSADYDTSLIDSVSNEIYCSEYTEDIKLLITDIINSTEELYSAIGESYIVNHQNKDSLSVTEYSNGVKVLINYGSQAVSVYGIQVDPQGFEFIIEKGES